MDYGAFPSGYSFMKKLLLLVAVFSVGYFAWLERREILTRVETEATKRWYLGEIRAASQASSIDLCLLVAMVHVESKFNPRAVSGSGAMGLMQLLPSTARETARKNGMGRIDTGVIMAPDSNVLLGAFYLRKLLDQFGDTDLAVAAYNGGPADVREWLEEGDTNIETFGKEETRRYVDQVRETYSRLKRLQRAWRWLNDRT
jgi:soluble lytic murein transglycosylase